MGDTHWLIHLSWGLSKGNISLGTEETHRVVGRQEPLPRSSWCVIKQCCNWPGSLSDSVMVVLKFGVCQGLCKTRRVKCFIVCWFNVWNVLLVL